MKATVSMVGKLVDQLSLKHAVKRANQQEITKKCMELHNVPRSITLGIITGVQKSETASEPILFAILHTFKELGIEEARLEQYFDGIEINKYLNWKYTTEKLTFPIRFRLSQITERQWTGPISTEMLIQLRKMQITAYDANIQRPMTTVIRNGVPTQQITVNPRSLKAIEKSMEAGTFTPNVLTFDIKEDDPLADFYYDEDAGELVIYNVNKLYIADGYHRIRAIYNCYDRDNSFNQPMELRIINFSDSEVRGFINQEEQKTHIRKIDAKAYDMTSAANRIIERLNNDPTSNMQGTLNRSSFLINLGELSQMIEFFWFKKLKRDEGSRVEVVRIATEIKEDFNILTSHYPELMERMWSYNEVLSALYIFYRLSGQDTKGEMIEKYHNIKEKLDTSQKKVRRAVGVNTAVLKYLDELYEGSET